METAFEKFRKKLKRLNGANIINIDKKGRILVFRSTYGGKYFMLPGGGLERNELPQHAAQSETEEETGKYPTNASLKLVGVFMQRVPGISDTRGFMFLFVSDESQGEIEESDESVELQYMSIAQIFKRRAEFGTSYIRMIAHYVRWTQDGIVMPKRLSETVYVTIGKKTYEI